MGGRPFFVVGKKRTSKLSDDGRRFMPKADALIEAWNATLSTGPRTDAEIEGRAPLPSKRAPLELLANRYDANRRGKRGASGEGRRE